MTCQQTRGRLLEMSVDEFAGLEHLKECAECARFAEAIIASEADLHRALDVVLDGDVDRVAEIARPPTAPNNNRSFPMWTLVATGLAVAASATLVMLPGPTEPTMETPMHVVPAGVNWAVVEFAVEHAEAADTSAFGQADWRRLRDTLHGSWIQVEMAPDREEHPDLVKRLGFQLGLAAEAAGDKEPPWFLRQHGTWVNAAWHATDSQVGNPMLASMEVAEPTPPTRPEPHPGGLAETYLLTEWNAMDSAGWQDASHQLWDAAAEAEGQARFELLTAAGYAAENVSPPSPPFYAVFEGGRVVNVALARAAAMATQDPSLLTAFAEQHPQHKALLSQLRYFRDHLTAKDLEQLAELQE